MFKVASVLILACLYPALLEAARPSDVKLKILQEQQFVEQAISGTKSWILGEVASERARLNSRADGLKSNIKAGTSKCHQWYEHIESLQKSMINFMYQYQSCELNRNFDALRKTKFSLQTMMREADKLIALCTVVSPSSCQSQTNSMNSAIDLIHANDEGVVATIRSETPTCIAGKSSNVERLMDSANTSWQKCVSSN